MILKRDMHRRPKQESGTIRSHKKDQEMETEFERKKEAINEIDTVM